MKKYAMMLMNPLFQPQEDTAYFRTGNIENYILTVRNEEEALEKVEELVKEGIGVLEVCGAFGQEMAHKMRQVSQGKLCIGYVVYEPDQMEQLENFWATENDGD